MSRAAVVLLLAVAALVVGCGGSSPSSGEPDRHESGAAQAVRATVQGWLSNLKTPKQPGDNTHACSYLTPALQRSISEQLRVRGEHGTCRTWAAKWTGGSNPPGRDGAHVTAINVSGAKATATLQAPPDRESDVQLERVGRRWLISNY